MLKARACSAGSLGLGLLLAACDSSSGPVSQEDIVGKWTITSAHETGWRIDDEGVKQSRDYEDTRQVGHTREFKADHTLVFEVGIPLTGTWSLSGNTLTTLITVFGSTDTTRSTVTLEGKQATFVTRNVDEWEDIVTTIKAARP